MITYQTRRPVTHSAEDAFDVIGINVYDNHPRWEPEVVEIRRISHGPVGVGSRAVMVRRDYGRRSEVLYEVTEFDPPRRIAFHHPDAGVDFDVRFDLTPLDDRSCELSVQTARATSRYRTHPPTGHAGGHAQTRQSHHHRDDRRDRAHRRARLTTVRLTHVLRPGGIGPDSRPPSGHKERLWRSAFRG